MEVIGSDRDGVTSTSLKNIEKFSKRNLVRVYIDAASPSTCITSFIFEGEEVYRATGFSIGYGGEGPRGLWKAIRIFHPNKIEQDFWDTPIASLGFDTNWMWTPDNGFKSA